MLGVCPAALTQVVAIFARLLLLISTLHLVEPRMPRIAQDLEIDRARAIAVEGVVHGLLGQVGHGVA